MQSCHHARPRRRRRSTPTGSGDVRRASRSRSARSTNLLPSAHAVHAGPARHRCRARTRDARAAYADPGRAAVAARAAAGCPFATALPAAPRAAARERSRRCSAASTPGDCLAALADARPRIVVRPSADDEDLRLRESPTGSRRVARAAGRPTATSLLPGCRRSASRSTSRYSGKRGPPQGGVRPRRRAASPSTSRGRDPRPRRRVGLRQDDARPHVLQLMPADLGSVRLRRRRT